MVRVVVEFDAPGLTEAALLLTAVKTLAEEHPPWRFVDARVGEQPLCPACGGPMTWRAELQVYACSHPE